MKEDWIKFDYDDGAEVFYMFEQESDLVHFKTVISDTETKRFSLFFDEIEELYNTICRIRYSK